MNGLPPVGLIAFDCVARRGVLGTHGIRSEIQRVDGRPVARRLPVSIPTARSPGPVELAGSTTRHSSSSPSADMWDHGALFSTQQLAEFLAVVSSLPDQANARQVGVERAAEALEAEVAAVVQGDAVLTSVGFPAALVPEAELVEAAAHRQVVIEFPGLGECQTISVALDEADYLVVARAGEDSYTLEEISLLRAMARVLALSLQMLRTLEAERTVRERSERHAAENATLLATLQERQRLLEQLSSIQRAISRRAPLQQILDAITAGAKDLLGDEVVGLRLIDAEDPTMS